MAEPELGEFCEFLSLISCPRTIVCPRAVVCRSGVRGGEGLALFWPLLEPVLRSPAVVARFTVGVDFPLSELVYIPAVLRIV